MRACRDSNGAPTLSEASHGGSGSTNTADPESSFTSRTQAVLSHLQVLCPPICQQLAPVCTDQADLQELKLCLLSHIGIYGIILL